MAKGNEQENVKQDRKVAIAQLCAERCAGHDEVRAHIEYAYAHYDDFIRFCKRKAGIK